MDKTPTMTAPAHDKPPRNVIIIYSPRMAGYLMMRGFYIIGMQPNKKQPGKNCFSFFESQALQDAMQDYIDRKFTV